MFKLRKKVTELEKEIEDLKETKEIAESELRRVKHDHKMEEEDTKHLVKLREEKLNIEFQKKEMQVEKEKQDVIAEVKDAYRDKMEANLNKQISDIKGMYGQILERLPNVNVKMSK